MQAAFVDIGLEKAAFLYVADVLDVMEQVERRVEGDTEPAGEEESELPPLPPIEGSSQGRAGAAGADLQGADRHQGRPDYLAHLTAGPPPGLHADRRSCWHLAAHRM